MAMLMLACGQPKPEVHVQHFVLILCLLCLVLAQTAGAAPGDEIYAKPGRLVPTRGTRLNLYCMGRGSPTVVFESGWEDWSPVWAFVQPRVAQSMRACSYDRAGAGFSDAATMPRSSVRIADELHEALRHAGIDGPYVLVGHAYGGDVAQTFAQRYLKDVAGMVLVEADVGGPEADTGNASYIASLRECRDAIAAGKPLPRQRASSGSESRDCAQQFFRGLPEQQWSPELNAKLNEIAHTKVAMYDSYISEMEQMRANKIYLAHHAQSLGSRPIRVLSTGYHGVHALDAEHPQTAEQQAYEQRVAQAQAKWLALSKDAKQVFVADSSEYIPLDKPDAVVEAIRDVAQQMP